MIHAKHARWPLMLAAGFLFAACLARVHAAPADEPADTLRAGDPAAHGLDKAKLDTLRAILNKAVADGVMPGASLLVAHRGEIIFKEAVGTFTPDDEARMASDTKPTTAAVVMMVVEEGKLSLDDTISKYVPEFKGTPVENATIRQLLSHTGGVGGNYPGGRPTSGTLAEFARLIAREGTLKPPGKFSYSGVSIDLAARAAEAAAGVPFEELARTRLWKPLGMSHTSYSLAADAASVSAEDAARGEGRYVSGGGGLSSTLDDFAAFYQMFAQGGRYAGKTILSEASIAAMHTPIGRNERYVNSPSEWGPDYGLGFYLSRSDESGKPRTIHHGGALGTMAWADLDHDVTAVFFSQVGLAKAAPVIVALQKQTRRIIAGDSNEATDVAVQPAPPAADAPSEPAENPAGGRLGGRVDLAARFKQISEGNETITREQYLKNVASIGSGKARPRLGEQIFDRLDENKDGELTLDEYRKIGSMFGARRGKQ